MSEARSPPDGRIPWQPWALAKKTYIRDHPFETRAIYDYRIRCLPAGTPRGTFYSYYNGWQIQQPPGRVVILYEHNHLYREIRLDGTKVAEHTAEGGTAGCGARYAKNCRILVDGLRALGFETLLPDALQAPIIVTVRMPADPKFNFESFYDRLSRRGFVIYPGKLTVADSFRIGCIGRLGENEMRGVLRAIGEILAETGVSSCAPAPAEPGPLSQGDEP